MTGIRKSHGQSGDEATATDFDWYNAVGPTSAFMVSLEGLVSGSLALIGKLYVCPPKGTVCSTRCTPLQESDQITIFECSFVMAM